MGAAKRPIGADDSLVGVEDNPGLLLLFLACRVICSVLLGSLDPADYEGVSDAVIPFNLSYRNRLFQMEPNIPSHFFIAVFSVKDHKKQQSRHGRLGFIPADAVLKNAEQA